MTRKSATTTKAVVSNREEMIAVAAYFRAERRGFAPGDTHADWLAAAAEIDRLLGDESAGQDQAAKAKQKFQKQLVAQLKEWDAKLDEWTEKAAAAKSKTRNEYQKQLDLIVAQREIAEKKLLELRSHSVDAWEDVKDGAEKVWAELRQTMDKVAARFK